MILISPNHHEQPLNGSARVLLFVGEPAEVVGRNPGDVAIVQRSGESVDIDGAKVTAAQPGVVHLRVNGAHEQVSVEAVCLPLASLEAGPLVGAVANVPEIERDLRKRVILRALVSDDAVTPASLAAALAAHPGGIVPQLLQRPAHGVLSLRDYGGA